MSIIKLITTVGLAVALITMITSNQPSIYASPTTEDDGWTEGDYEGSSEEQEEQAQDDWEDAGRPGDDDDDDDEEDNDPLPYCDTSEGKTAPACHDRLDYSQGGPENGLYPCNDGTYERDYKDCKDASKKDLPICEYLVVKDCVVNEIGQKCLVGTSDDPCQDIFYGYDGDLKPGEKTFNPNNDNDNGGSNSNSDDLPGCQNGVLQKCVIKEIGLICHPEHRFLPPNPSVVGGGHACQDVYAGHYVYNTKEYGKLGEVIGQFADGSVMKRCGDGKIAVSCGM